MKTSKVQSILQKYLMPIANKVEQQKHLQAIKEGMIGIIPIIILGSFCLLPIAVKNLLGSGAIADFIGRHMKGLTYANQFTTGLIAIYAVFFIANALAKRYDFKSNFVGITAMVVFLILSGIPIKDGLGTAYLGAEGLFTSIVAAILTVEVTRFMVNKKLVIKLPDSVPEMVGESFSILFPFIVNVIIATSVSMLVQYTTGSVFPQWFMKILAPAVGSMDTLPAILIVVFLTQLLWFFGLHGPGITSAVWVPFAVSYGAANVASYAAGQPVSHFFTFGFYYALIQVTGSGLTLGLVILMMRSKSKNFSAIGKASIIPSIFGINEPVIFGAPIILNPFLFIPFVFGPLIIATICYLTMSLGIVGMPIAEPPSFLPPGVGAFLMTLDWKAVVLVFACLALMTLIYYPFFKAMEAEELKKEIEA
ncbi:PTS transporter subunit EIIC [Vallitalea sediminicola]